MAKSVIEPAQGTKNKSNTTFSTSATYTPGTLFVFLNGQLQRKDVVTELGGTIFQVDDAPAADDDFYVRYVTIV